VGGILVFTVEALDSANGLKSDNDDNIKNNNNDNMNDYNEIDNNNINSNNNNDDNNNNNNNKNIQNNDKDHNNDNNMNYSLQSSGRIAHTYKYIKNISINSKFHILEISKATPRTDKGRPVRGYIVALRK
jgi:hypothetical protein